MFMEYITLGTDKILEEYFYQIINSDRKIKPVGGLWSSDYFAPTFNEWLDYLIGKPTYYCRYTLGNDPFKMKAAIIKLYDDARVFHLDSKDAISELEQKYNFDFERLSEDYDALYANPYALFDYSEDRRELYRRVYAVKSLDVFDLSVVEGYKKAMIDIEPFDYTYSGDDVAYYNTIVNPKSFSVQGESDEYKDFLEALTVQLKDFIFHLRLEHPNFPPNKMVSLIKEELDKIIGPDLIEYAKRNELDPERLGYSLSTKAYRKVK